MRKLLLSLFAMICAVGMNAQATIDFNDIAALGITEADFTTVENGQNLNTYYEITSGENSVCSIGNAEVTVTIAQNASGTTAKIWKNTDGTYELRAYKQHTLTITLKDGSAFTAIKGVGGAQLDYSGEATTSSSATISATIKIKSLTITTESGEVPETPETPETPVTPEDPDVPAVTATIDFNDLASIGITEADFTEFEQKDGSINTYYEITSGENSTGSVGNATVLVTIAQNAGTTTAKIWKNTNGTYELRAYKQHTLTITLKDGTPIAQIKGVGGTQLDYSGETKSAVEITLTETAKIKSLAISSQAGDTPEPPTPEIQTVTIAEALAIIDALNNAGQTSEQYILEGTITNIQEVSTEYGNATFTISDGTSEILIFRAKDIDNQNFTDAEKIKAGDKVKVQGKLKKYVKDDVVTPEVTNGWLLSINEEETAVTSITADHQSPIFDLAGRRVQKVAKGIYIKDGKKILF
ncbi:MAG: hypothetical protein HUK02_05505 [Bacteroidaceae bacterium]|nr:hypothetical protein [Bacteroidaceae bacterium]